MAFCEKCGKELGPDGVCDCQKASAEPVAPAASETPASSAAPAAPTVSAVPAESAHGNNKLIGIIAVAAIAVVLLIVIFSLVGKGGSYKDPFKDLQKLINKQSTDIFAYQKDINDPLSANFVKKVYDIAKGSDDVKEGYKDQQEDLKDFYDDIKGFKITEIEIKKAEKMKGSELRSIKDNYDKDNFESILEMFDDLDSDDYEDLAESLDISKGKAKDLVKAMKSYYQSLGKAKVQEGYNVQVIVRAKYDGDTDKTDRIDVQVVKINGKWFINNAGSFFRNIRFDKDLDDVSLYGLYNRINYNLGSGFLSGF